MATFKRSWLIPGALSLLAAATIISRGHVAIAQSTEEMIATAEKVCIDAAVTKGYDERLSQVISAESVDSDTVEVVLNLTRDGKGFARLTCPYSVSKGAAVFDDAGAVFEEASDAVTGAADVVRTTRFPWWWLLLPLIGLPLLLWWVRGRDTAGEVYPHYTEAYVNTYGTPLNVYEAPNKISQILRTLNDGTHVLLTGRQDDHWVELRDGGWVDMHCISTGS